jgi:hypothetical protein
MRVTTVWRLRGGCVTLILVEVLVSTPQDTSTGDEGPGGSEGGPRVVFFVVVVQFLWYWGVDLRALDLLVRCFRT